MLRRKITDSDIAQNEHFGLLRTRSSPRRTRKIDPFECEVCLAVCFQQGKCHTLYLQWTRAMQRALMDGLICGG